MPIKMKSNRSFMIKLIIPFVVVLFLCVVGVSITLCFEYDKELIPILIFFCVFLSVMMIAALIIKFYKGASYEFTENEIICYKRNRLLSTINISDIEKIEFYQYKWRYIITIFVGELPTGGCWSLHVLMNDGTKKILRFFSKKDAETLKEKLFGNLLTII